jgi:hypothetical protein
MKTKTPIRKRNPERQAKRRSGYAKKLAAYRRSKTFKIVESRSDGCCEAQIRTFDYCGNAQVHRCGALAVAHHHQTYARFGGDELPTDIIAVCKRCHEKWPCTKNDTLGAKLRAGQFWDEATQSDTRVPRSPASSEDSAK